MNAEFVAQIADFARNAGKSLDDTAIAIVTTLYRGVIMATPVGSPTIWKDENAAQRAVENGYTGGRLRGNWQLTVGLPADGFLEITGDQGKALAEQLAASLPAMIDVGEVHYLTNNLPYAATIEYDGHSQQAPAGMVRLSMANLAAAIPGAIQEHAL